MNAGGNVGKAVVVLMGIQLFSFACTRLAAQEYRMRQIEPFAPPAAETNIVQVPGPVEVGEAGETEDLGPQIVLRRRKQPLFSLSSDTEVLYSSNVALSPHHPVSDELLFQTLGVSFTPPVLQQFSPALYVRQQFVCYSTQSALDFDTQTAGLSFATPVMDWFNLYGDFSASRAYSEGNDGEFYREFDAELGLWRSTPLTRNASLYYGYQEDWLPSSPSDLAEWDNAIYAGLNVRLIGPLSAQYLTRVRLREYFQSSRTDLDYLLSAALNCTFNRYVMVRAYATYAYNNSNQPEFRYSVDNLGAALDLSIRF